MRNLRSFIEEYSGEKDIAKQIFDVRAKACTRCPKMMTRMAAQCECPANDAETELLDSLFALALRRFSKKSNNKTTKDIEECISAKNIDLITFHRKKLYGMFVSAGFTLTDTRRKRNCLWTLKHKTSGTVTILTGIALHLRPHNQVAFTLRGLQDKNVDWYALMAVPFEQVFIFKREELTKNHPGHTRNLTLSRGSHFDKDFDQRIKELI